MLYFSIMPGPASFPVESWEPPRPWPRRRPDPIAMFDVKEANDTDEFYAALAYDLTLRVSLM